MRHKQWLSPCSLFVLPEEHNAARGAVGGRVLKAVLLCAAGIKLQTHITLGSQLLSSC
jgi:hypothetical protein